MKQALKNPVVVFILVVLPGILIGVFSYWKIRTNLTQDAFSRRSAIAYLSSTLLEERLERVHDLGISLATRVTFRDLIKQGDWHGARDIVRDIPQHFSFIDHLNIVSVDGLIKEDVPTMQGAIGTDVSDEDWFQKVTREKSSYLSNVKTRELPDSRSNIATFGFPIFDRDNPDSVIAVLGLEIRLNTIFKWSEYVDVGNTGFVYFIDRRGVLIANKDYSVDNETIDYSSVPTVERILAGNTGVEILYNPIEKEERLVAYQPVQKYGWGVIAQQKVEDAFAERDRTLHIILLVFGVVILISVTTALLIINANKHLADQANELQKKGKQIQIKNEELEHKNKELEQFAYVTSHDLQEPLRSLSNYTELLSSEYADKLDETGQKSIRFISEATTRMRNLIQALLEYSRLGHKKEITTIDCNKLIEEVQFDLSQKINILNARVIADKLPKLNGHETELRLLFQNLISNALKFHRVDVIPQIKVAAKEENGLWKFSFSDNGIGIAENHQKKIFNIFQRLHTRKEYEGTGIGLAHCQKIIDLHGGKIWVESQVNNGSTFHFTIPK
ncbi:two-component sensor histidine kinase [Fulvivirga imtechensis AK7]|uniref:histidine kinase n=1 Tax=Fulvivirga imtechensis AK7 TaxID=1237149 RepID=L8JQL1_9BACT|nr:sensor histidine kinase [Fulvivirga imtechensis]ELR71150.1 two-component sensor histidine kinase [Fulvivirga imtechensis AK7]